jgi:anti-anti-sigma factor
MTLPPLTVHRHDRGKRSLVTLAGELDPTTAPLVRGALAGCLEDGMTSIDVDLTAVPFCDSSALNVFLEAAGHATTAHASLVLHHPSAQTARLLALTGTAPLLLGPPAPPAPPSLLNDIRMSSPPSPPSPPSHPSSP